MIAIIYPIEFVMIIIAIIMIDTIIQRRDSRGQKVLIKICLRRTVIAMHSDNLLFLC